MSFLILRHMPSLNHSLELARKLFEFHDRYPNSIDEIWFGCGAFDGVEEIRRQCDELLPLREECRRRGIAFSLQQGVTIGHGVAGPIAIRKGIFIDNDTLVDQEGTFLYGMLCPTSPKVFDYLTEQTAIYLTELQPESYWPDDDLRVGTFKPVGCFCNRCIALFNKEISGSFTRETLAIRLFSDKPELKLRRTWQQFNARNIAHLATAFRKGCDKTMPECHLGIQSTFSSRLYDMETPYQLLYALSDNGRAKVGIRPGALFYSESNPRELLSKMQETAREAARCRKYGFVSQICYELENYPHIAMLKTPEAMMTEAAMALFAGADSLALYYHDVNNRETDENYRYYFETVAKYRPFLEKIRDIGNRSDLAGGAFYRGKDAVGQPEWHSCSWTPPEERDELHLMENAVPITQSEAVPEFYILNEHCVRTLAADELGKLFASTILMDITAFSRLCECFPELQATKKVRLHPDVPAAVGVSCEFYEKNSAMGMTTPIEILSNDVRPFSTVSMMMEAAGSVIIPTEFGGNIVLIQQFENWTGFRRMAILDVLDTLIPGKMSVRLDAPGYAVNVQSRVDCEKRCIAAMLLNLSIGAIPPAELRLRRPAAKEYELVTAAGSSSAPVVRQSADEIVIAVPALAPWQILLIQQKATN
ncbi:hypothetical protein [Victivallis lenta]|uniref:hypothetical protein n=1 Tax=Victivallis lenta TaxID=2606640 RepID=UPI00197F78A1|nr:hypothetical protein [Victivallis lenta]